MPQYPNIYIGKDMIKLMNQFQKVYNLGLTPGIRK
jgi:hypothetical protein